MVKSLEEQSRQLWHTTNVYLHPKIHEYVEKLAAKMPGNLKVSAVHSNAFITDELNPLCRLLVEVQVLSLSTLDTRQT